MPTSAWLQTILFCFDLSKWIFLHKTPKMLERIFKQAEYPEDQEHAHAVLISHVVHRGINLGALLGLGRVGISELSAWNYGTANEIPALRSVARASLWTSGVITVMLMSKLQSKEYIEWQDRSWRLLGHETQRRVDYWSIGGAGIGAIAGLLKPNPKNASLFARGFGGGALGSLAGVVALEAYKIVQGDKTPTL